MATSTMLALGFHTVIEGHDVFIGALLRAACWFTTPSSEPDGAAARPWEILLMMTASVTRCPRLSASLTPAVNQYPVVF